MMNKALLLAAFAAAPVLAASPLDQLDALTDKMKAQAARDARLAGEMAEGRVLVPSTSPYLGRPVADPLKLPFYRSLGAVQFSDGLIAHTVHYAVDAEGRHRLVVLAHGIVRGETDQYWRVADDEVVSPPKGTVFVGSDAGRMACWIKGNPMLSFGFLKPVDGQYVGTGATMYAVDPYSNLIPLLPEFAARCRKSD